MAVSTQTRCITGLTDVMYGQFSVEVNVAPRDFTNHMPLLKQSAKLQQNKNKTLLADVQTAKIKHL